MLHFEMMKVSRNLDSSSSSLPRVSIPQRLYSGSRSQKQLGQKERGLKLKVVSWNIHRCFGTDRRYWPERVAEALALMDADVVALQEVDSSLRVQGEIDQLSYLAGAIGMKAVMGPTLKRDYGAYGNAILTRETIVDSSEHNLSYRKFEPRGALVAHMQIAERPVKIINVHLGLKYWERTFQIGQVLEKLVWSAESPESPLILLGDFNEWFPYTPNQFRLNRSFQFRSRPINTFPSPWPRFALDRIFVGGDVKSLDCAVITEKKARIASDHLPLMASIEF